MIDEWGVGVSSELHCDTIGLTGGTFENCL